MRARSFLSTYAIAFGMLSLPFIILFLTSFFILINSELISLGLTFSVISSFIIAYNFRKYKKSVFFSNNELFLSNLISSSQKFGYLLKNKTTTFIEFEPTVYANFFTGNISISLHNNSATIEGSKLYVKSIANS